MVSQKQHGGSIVVEIIDDVEVEVKGRTINVRGKLGELNRKFSEDFVHLDKENGKIKLWAKSKRFPKRKQMAIMGAIAGHIKNMMDGVTKGFKYKMKVVYSHFPMKVNANGDHILIDNFLGEKYPRKSKVLDGVDVKINGQEIVLSGIDKEKVGQTAANIEQSTKVKNLDIRVFQDGIYIIEKAGKPI